MKNQVKVLFVCLGNICRSPVAENSFRHLVEQRQLDANFVIDSAGTSAYHIGEPPNSKAQQTAQKHGIELEGQARQFERDDFHNFDYIFAMDQSNLRDILRLAENDSERERVIMFRQFDPEMPSHSPAQGVPDPYYGGMAGFEEVQQIALRTSENILAWLLERHQIGANR